MAVEHVDILTGEAHEPKHITTGTTGDNGKHITPSDAANSVSLLEYPKAEKLDSIDVSAAVNAVAGTLLVADGSGGMVFEPAGVAGATVAGLVYGSMEYHTAGVQTTAIASSGVYVALDNSWAGALSAGLVNGVVFTAGPPAVLTATYAGTYLTLFSGSYNHASGNNKTMQLDCAIDGTETGDFSKRFTTNAVDIGSISHIGIHAMTATQTARISVQNTGDTINFEWTSVDFIIVRLGP